MFQDVRVEYRDFVDVEEKLVCWETICCCFLPRQEPKRRRHAVDFCGRKERSCRSPRPVHDAEKFVAGFSFSFSLLSTM